MKEFSQYFKGFHLLGTHVSSAGGPREAPVRGKAVGVQAIQLFAKNNNQWFGKKITEEEADAFKKAKKENDILYTCSHAGYLINLAAPDPDNYKKSLSSMKQEIDLAEILGLDGIVLHPGAHRDTGEKKGIQKIIKSLNELFDKTPDFKTLVLLETTAGQGTAIGYTFEHLAEIMDGIENKKRIGVCLDTCHIFAAGYELRDKEGYEKTWKSFDSIVGLKNLKAIHLNDSKKEFASRRDRHEHIGKGRIGKEGFILLMNDKRLRKIPMILETPKADPIKDDLMNLKLLKSLVI